MGLGEIGLERTNQGAASPSDRGIAKACKGDPEKVQIVSCSRERAAMTLARIDWNLSIGAGGSVANRLREGGDFEQKLTKENEGNDPFFWILSFPAFLGLAGLRSLH